MSKRKGNHQKSQGRRNASKNNGQSSLHTFLASSPSVLSTSSHEGVNGSNIECPVCGKFFREKDIALHCEAHFNTDTSTPIPSSTAATLTTSTDKSNDNSAKKPAA